MSEKTLKFQLKKEIRDLKKVGYDGSPDEVNEISQ